MDRRLHRIARSGRGLARRVGAAAIVATIGLIAATADQRALDAADAERPAELVTSRQCDRCGFGSMRLETPHRHGSVSVGFLTDEQLARISALLGVPGRRTGERWLGALDHARPPRAPAAAREDGATGGEAGEPRFTNDTAAALFEAMTTGGGAGAANAAVTLGPSSIQLIDVDETGWVSLTLRTPEFAYQTIYSP